MKSGIFAIIHSSSKSCYIGSSYNLDLAEKIEFNKLAKRVHSSSKLQSLYIRKEKLKFQIILRTNNLIEDLENIKSRCKYTLLNTTTKPVDSQVYIARQNKDTLVVCKDLKAACYYLGVDKASINTYVKGYYLTTKPKNPLVLPYTAKKDDSIYHLRHIRLATPLLEKGFELV